MTSKKIPSIIAWRFSISEDHYQEMLRKAWAEDYGLDIGTPKFYECIFAQIFYLKQKNRNFVFYNIINEINFFYVCKIQQKIMNKSFPHEIPYFSTFDMKLHAK